jgi:hypothetical protein
MKRTSRDPSELAKSWFLLELRGSALNESLQAGSCHGVAARGQTAICAPQFVRVLILRIRNASIESLSSVRPRNVLVLFWSI